MFRPLKNSCSFRRVLTLPFVRVGRAFGGALISVASVEKRTHLNGPASELDFEHTGFDKGIGIQGATDCLFIRSTAEHRDP